MSEADALMERIWDAKMESIREDNPIVEIQIGTRQYDLLKQAPDDAQVDIRYEPVMYVYGVKITEFGEDSRRSTHLGEDNGQGE